MKRKQLIMNNEIPKVLDNNDTDTVHTKMTYNIKFYKCEVCEKWYKSDSALNKHKIKKQHIFKKGQFYCGL